MATVAGDSSEPMALSRAWLAAFSARNDAEALELGERLIASHACPLPVRMCLPSCALGARGAAGHDARVDRLARGGGAVGVETALVLVAASRLHPAQLGSAVELDPRLLLLAAALAAAGQGRADRAAPWWPLCARPSMRPTLLESLVEALARRPPQGPALPPPPGPPSPEHALRLALAMHDRARALGTSGAPADALRVAHLALTALDGLVDRDHPRVLALRLTLGDLERTLALHDRAQGTLASALSAAAVDGERSRVLAREIAIAQARVELERDRPDAARALLEGLPHDDDEPAHVAAARRVVEGAALVALDAPAAALTPLEAALRWFDEGPADRHGGLGDALHWAALAHAREGALETAEALLARAIDVRVGWLGPDHPDLAASRLALGTLAANRGDLDLATRLFQLAVDGLVTSLGPRDARAVVAIESLTHAHLELGRFAEADPWVRVLLASSDTHRRPHWRALLERVETALAPAFAAAGPAGARAVRLALERGARDEMTSARAMRTLVAHDGWLCPHALAAFGRRDGAADLPIALGTGDVTDDGPVAIFTDEAALRRALDAGALRGRYAGPVDGVELFAKLASQHRTALVDPLDDRAGFSLDAAALAQAGLWADRVHLERGLAAFASLDSPTRDASVIAANLRAFASFVTLLDRSTRGPLVFAWRDPGERDPGAPDHEAIAVFTAPDLAEAFRALLDPDVAARLDVTPLDGRKLAALAPEGARHALVLDPLGPAPLRLDRDTLAALRGASDRQSRR